MRQLLKKILCGYKCIIGKVSPWHNAGQRSPSLIVCGVVLGFSRALHFNNFIVFSLRSIFLLMLLLWPVAWAIFAPSLFLSSGCFWQVCMYIFTDVLSVMVPGGCRSQGCHGYLLGVLMAPFSFTRHFPHTHLLSMGFMPISLGIVHQSVVLKFVIFFNSLVGLEYDSSSDSDIS